LADLAARYIAQQRELGTDEVLLSRKRGEFLTPADRRIGGSAEANASERRVVGSADEKAEDRRVGGSADGAVAAPVAVPVRPSARPPVRPTTKTAADSPVVIDETSWRKNLPPIPAAGLTIDPPSALLLPPALAALDALDAVAAMIADCRQCPLCRTRNRTVPGEGNPSARLMLVGEGPGATEDETGRPFVGAAGELLSKILGSIGIARDAVYIANIVKCRPPQNRKPLPEETAACLPYLHRQIALVKPKVLIALGGTAAESLLGVKKALGELRNRVHRYDGIPLVVTYHPAALLRNPNWKKPTWDDVRIARQLLDL
jgi:DNA polymerase